MGKRAVAAHCLYFEYLPLVHDSSHGGENAVFRFSYLQTIPTTIPRYLYTASTLAKLHTSPRAEFINYNFHFHLSKLERFNAESMKLTLLQKPLITKAKVNKPIIHSGARKRKRKRGSRGGKQQQATFGQRKVFLRACDGDGN